MGPLKIVALVIGLMVLLFIVVSVVSSSVSGPSISFGDHVGVLEIDGVIGDGFGSDVRADALIRTLRKWAKDSSIKGLVVRINSPGGTVGATQEVYQQILQYRRDTGRPVIASMGDVAASGGFYTAMACDEIYANPGTLTGSVGVILRFMNYQQLSDKVGLQFNVIKSGEFKDIGSGSRPMTEAEKQLLQGMIDDVYGQFLEAVTNGRAKPVRELLAEKDKKKESDISYEDLTAYVKQYSDGRIFSGQQAQAYGLIDHLGTFQSAVDRVKKLAGLKGEPKLVSSRPPRGFFESLAGDTRTLVREYAPGKVSLEYRFALP